MIRSSILTRGIRAAIPLLLVAGLPRWAACSETRTAHIGQAEALVASLKGVADNHYGQGHRFIRWNPAHAAARTVCSSFTTLLLEHVYGWTDDDFKEWTGSRDPDAAPYHDAIVQENGFRRIREISHIAPGDFIAIKYNDGSADTGHVMMVDAAPVEQPAADPIVPGTTQYTVTVIDSSASGHGPDDTRSLGNGKFTGGIGRGVFRLYANRDGQIAGYAWSASRKSVYYHRPGRALVVGRLDR